MAGARGRKLDLSGYLSGSANVASILANADESGGIGGLLGGIGAGIRQAGSNLREDKVRREAAAEREKDRTFSQNLALRADARAERDQAMQEEEQKRKVAADAKVVEESAQLLARAQMSARTGMPMDPKVVEEIQKRATAIQASGGPQAIMARAAAQEEPDVEGLISETSRLETLTSLITAQMAREKDPARHAALGDSLMQLGSIVDVNKYRLRLHDANTKRKQAEAAAKAEAEAALPSIKESARQQLVAMGMNAEDATDALIPINDEGAIKELLTTMRGVYRIEDPQAFKTEQGALEEARLRATYKARTGQEAPKGVDVKKLREWEVQDERMRAVAEDRAETQRIARRRAAETERHNKAMEQLKALGNNPNKARMAALLDSARLRLANAKEYGDYESAVGDTTKAREAIEAATTALDEFDALSRQSGAAGTAPAPVDAGRSEADMWKEIDAISTEMPEAQYVEQVKKIKAKYGK